MKKNSVVQTNIDKEKEIKTENNKLNRRKERDKMEIDQKDGSIYSRHSIKTDRN